MQHSAETFDLSTTTPINDYPSPLRELAMQKHRQTMTMNRTICPEGIISNACAFFFGRMRSETRLTSK